MGSLTFVLFFFCPACGEKKKIGPCKAAMLRYFFHRRSGKCRQFLWGGCAANGNNFETIETCEMKCITCKLQKDMGNCTDNLIRWFHADGACKKFVYTGCHGNGNNFRSAKKCRRACL